MKRDYQRPQVDIAARDTLRQAFLAAQGLAAEEIIALPSDASFRRYFRLPKKNMLVMDSPPDLYPTSIFAAVSHLIISPSVRVAKIFSQDHEHGFLLLEDLGADSLTSLLKHPDITKEGEHALYQQVIESLFASQMAWYKKYHHGGAALPLARYDDATLIREAALLPVWYLPEENNIEVEDKELEHFVDILKTIHRELTIHHAPPDDVFVHRDFHVDNLLLVDDKIAWLDFQDGLIGHPTYDIMSLLEDARRDVPPQVKEKTWQYFLAAWQKEFPEDEKLSINFSLWFDFLGLTRHAKVLGIFVRLEKRDGKLHYRQHLPRVLRLLQRSMASLINGIATNLPRDKKHEALIGAVQDLQHLLQRWKCL